MKKKLIRFMRKLVSRINIKVSNKVMYKQLLGKKLDLKNPQTFNEKINWLKIYKYPNIDVIAKCADKYLVRDYLKKISMDKYLVRLIGVYKNVDEINWEKLPQKFVLKCNHGSGYNIICTNKKEFEKARAEKQLKKWLKEDFGMVSGEKHYSKIDRRIICEEYLGENLTDIQFWCSYGKVLFVSYIKNPHGDNEKATFDENWNKLRFVTSLPILHGKIERPQRFEEMLSVARKISKPYIFLRVDFYILSSGDIKLSELTFTPASGFVNWNPSNMDYEIGKLIDLNNIK